VKDIFYKITKSYLALQHFNISLNIAAEG